MGLVHKFAMTLGLALVLQATAASATPYVNVRASWDLFARSGLVPEGVSIACTGGAQGGGSGCSGGIGLNTTVSGAQSFAVSSTGSVVVTNITDHALTGYLDFITGFSAFNPGGPGIGVSVDDPLTQWGSFSSSVSGPGVFDLHHCSVGYLGQSGSQYSNHSCGVFSPDSSQGNAYIDLAALAPGASRSLTYGAFVSAQFDFMPVPEASSLALLIFGFMGIRPRARA